MSDLILSGLSTAKVWFPLDWGDPPPAGIDPAAEPPQIAFCPAVWTPKFSRAFYTVAKTAEETAAWYETVAQLVVDSTIYLTEEDRAAQQSLPITPEAFDEVPTPIRDAFWHTVGKAVGANFQLRPPPAPPTTPPAGSESRSGGSTAKGSRARRKRTPGS